MPAFNEEATVGEVVRATLARINATVVVVNDCSRDDTAAQARAAGAIVIDLSLQLGAWGATQSGIRLAFEQGFDAVVTMDADGQHRADTLPALVAALERPDQVVIGTFAQRLSRAKRIAWRYFRALTGLAVEDFTSGLRVYGREAMRLMASKQAILLDYQDIGVLLILRQHGIEIVERPVTMLDRTDGHSRVFRSWPVVARYMIGTSVLCFAAIGQQRRKLRLRRDASQNI